MTNMFAKAAKIETTKKPAAKKNDRPELAIAGIENLASIDAVMKALTALRATVEESVKGQMAVAFVADGEKIGRKPDSFVGIENGASASCELRKRSTASVLTDDEVALLEAQGITYETVETTKECFVINPAYKDDSKLLEKVSAALEKVKDMPEDFIMMQTGVYKRVVTDETVNQVFAKKQAEDLLSVVGVLAIKPKIEGGDIKSALKTIQGIIG